jgi:hypothetical protein
MEPIQRRAQQQSFGLVAADSLEQYEAGAEFQIVGRSQNVMRSSV